MMVQTMLTGNYCLKAAAKSDPEYFYRQELKERRELGFPPFRHLVAIGIRSVKEPAAFEVANGFFAALEQEQSKSIEIMEPHPDVIPKMRDKYRFTILLKGKSVEAMVGLIKKVLKTFKKKNVIISIDVDP